MKITEVTKAKAKTIHDLLGEVINDLKPDMTSTRPESFDSPEEELCCHLALMSISECVSGVKGLDHALNMTAEDVRQMCAEADVTVSTALHNCKMNMMGSIIESMIGRFTPPRLTRRCDRCLSSATLVSRVSSTNATKRARRLVLSSAPEVRVSLVMTAPYSVPSIASVPSFSTATPSPGSTPIPSKHCSGTSLPH